MVSVVDLLVCTVSGVSVVTGAYGVLLYYLHPSLTVTYI